jgi:serine protease Do
MRILFVVRRVGFSPPLPLRVLSGLKSTLLLCLAASLARAATTPPREVLTAESQRIELMAKVRPTVLAIFDPSGQGGGSGVVISADGYALSNFHVTHPCGNAMKCGMADGKVYDAVIVGLDPTGDIALIKVLGRDDFPHAELGDSDKLRVGDWVFAMGNPFLLAIDFQPTVTSGIISGTHRYQFPAGTLLEYADCLQTDASINPGNSGGPLFNGQGQLVGINGRCSFDKRGRVSVDVGYSVSINQIKNFLGVLRSGRIVDHATLGARVGVDEQGRVVVSDILETCDAYRRGLRTDDEIVSFAGRAISTPNGFKNALGIYPKGWQVPLSFRRENQVAKTYVRLAGVHSREDLIEKTLGRPAQPIPKPDEKGPKGPPGPKLPQLPQPRGPQMQVQKEPIPEAVKKVFQEKRGYANYYFNKLEQDRVLKQWKSPGDAKGGAPAQRVGGAWSFVGRLPSGKDIEFRLADKDASMKAPTGKQEWKLSANFADSFYSKQADGQLVDKPVGERVLPSLFLYHLLAVEGAKGFNEISYQGTFPLPGQDGLLDAVSANYRGIDAWFYFDSRGRLTAVEVYPEEHADPLEFQFSNYRTVDGRDLPGSLKIVSGGSVYETLDLQQFHFNAPEGKP